MRWLVLGYMQDGDGENKDAPTLLDSTVKMLVAMGTEKGTGETKDDVISTGDIAVAFLQGYNFDSTLEVQYVGHRPYPGAEIDVWEYSGPIYGDEAAPMNLHDTFSGKQRDEAYYHAEGTSRSRSKVLAEVEVAMQKYDDDKSGALDYMEFVNMFTDTTEDAVFKLKLPPAVIDGIRKAVGGIPGGSPRSRGRQ